MMIDKILTGPTLNFSSATHKTWLCQEKIGDTPVYLLHQVDNFAVATPTKKISDNIFKLLQVGLKQPLNLRGLLMIYNGLDFS